MEVTVRHATPTDAAAVAAAHVRGWQVAYQGIVPDAFLDALDVGQRTEQWRTNIETTVLANGLPAPTDYVAEIDDEVVGFANVGVFRGNNVDHRAGELWAMYVHPDHWGTGAGYALMNQTMTHFVETGIERAYLWVLEDNAQARRFYERQGWHADPETTEDEIGGAMIVSRRYSIDVQPRLSTT
jgi:GNAT superfamily N-acetyltransferase